MKITKVNIKNLGLFRDFKWDSLRDSENSVVNLKRENIFYGRNYSGKTTLSRILRALETKTISPKYHSPDFEIVFSDGTKINHANLQFCKLNIRCFNEDFIRENLRFIIDPDAEIKPFAILGENSGIEQQIEEIKRDLGEKNEDIKTLKYKELEDLSESVRSKGTECSRLQILLDSQLTDKATGASDSIKKRHSKFGDINYTITKLKQDIAIVKSPTYVPIDSLKEALDLKIISEVQKNDVKKTVNFDNAYTLLVGEVKTLLYKPLLDSDKIAELLNNFDLHQWVKKGYELHFDDRTCECKFCGNLISQSRWSQLDSHFDEESKKLEASLIHLNERIGNEISKVAEYHMASKDLFYISFQDELNVCFNAFSSHMSNYKNDLEFLQSKVMERLSSLHRSISFHYSPSLSESDLTSTIEDYEDIILRNNKYSTELSKKINEAKVELKLLEVKRFVDTIKFDRKQQEITIKTLDRDSTRKVMDTLQNEIFEKEKEIEKLTRLLNNEEEGAKKVNEYLQSYFGHQNLELQAIEEELDSDKKIRFNIVRNSGIAYHLSEGECSIISFCYFMARLDDIHTAGQKPIILIDDPISSLDSNHIFYVFSLINSELFIKARFEQIFISTHNLEFLKYLKRLKTTKNDHEYFIINRYQEHSTISLMPKYLKDYVTEFNFLFEQIYRCAKVEQITDENHHIYYNFGNNARKFLEALLFYKYPCRADNQTKGANLGRLLRYFGGDQQATILTDRVNNELSHLEEIFDRGMNPIEIPELKKVAQFILDKIKERDRDQYSALLESIGEPPDVSQVIIEQSLT